MKKILTKSGRDIGTLSTRSLRRYECGLCEQRLDRLRRSPKACGSLYRDMPCHWHETLNPKPKP